MNNMKTAAILAMMLALSFGACATEISPEDPGDGTCVLAPEDCEALPETALEDTAGGSQGTHAVWLECSCDSSGNNCVCCLGNRCWGPW